MADSGTIDSTQDNTLLEGFWPTFNTDGSLFNVTESSHEKGSLADWTCEQFGITTVNSLGGPLSNIDIKRMDAMTVINQSLMEAITGGKLVEPIVNEDGAVDFVVIGADSGNITDIYYTVQTTSLKDTVQGVMVTGQKPLPYRNAIVWKPIWGEGEASNLHIYNYRDMLSNCNLENFSRYAMLTFTDPFLDTSYNDGVNNLFDITNPWESLMGYVYYKKIPKKYVVNNKEYSVDYNKTALVPVRVGVPVDASGGGGIVEKIANLGSSLALLPQYDKDAAGGQCWSDSNQGVVPDFSDGVKVPIRTEEFNDLLYQAARDETLTIDKYIGINEVYVIGIEVAYMRTSPTDNAAAVTAKTSKDYPHTTWVSIQDKQRKAFKLNANKQYAVVYENDTDIKKQPYIVFTKDTRASDPAKYGTSVPFRLYQGCKLARDLGASSSTQEFTASILPIEKNRAILVEDIWALVELDTPSIVINDPLGNADKIADDMIYYAAAMRVTKKPAPIGYASINNSTGVVIDQASSMQDNDPTTAMNAETKSDLENAYDQMQGGGMAITLSFLEEGEVAGVAASLYAAMQYDGVATVHTCGPCCLPKLGGTGTTGIVNSIQYSYSDKGSYTVSVQEGAKIVGGLTPVDGGPTQKMAEDHQATGQVIEDAGNSVHFKVLIDGYGSRWALSTQPNIIRRGDVVSVTVHNNPVEA